MTLTPVYICFSEHGFPFIFSFTSKVGIILPQFNSVNICCLYSLSDYFSILRMLGYAGEDKEQAEVKSLNSTFSASVYIF